MVTTDERERHDDRHRLPATYRALREQLHRSPADAADATPEPSTVLLAAGDPRLRAQARRNLDGWGFEVVGEAADAAGSVAMARATRPDVALLGTRMPGGGIRAAASLAIAVPDTAVVMYSDAPDDRDLFEALQVGARGYLWHDMDPARLPLALKGVLAGEAAIPRQLVARLVQEFRWRERPRRLRLPGGREIDLTPRQWDVLELLRQGLGTREIADLLYISKATVRTHVAAILHKLGVDSRDEAIAAVAARGVRHAVA